MFKIINIVICYNNAEEVSKYVKHIAGLHFSETLVMVIVINSASEAEQKKIDSLSSFVPYEIIIVRPKRNLGYMKGLIYGYKAYRHKYSKVPQYVIMGNTDIEIPDKDFLVKLENKDYEEDIWCIGPSVYTKYTGNYDNPVALTRRSKKEINSLIFRFSMPVLGMSYVWLSKLKPRFIRRRRQKSQKVYELHGCFFILTGVCAEHMTDHKFTPSMYSEETFIAEIVYENGKTEYYDADLEVIHEEHTVTRLLGNRKIAKHLSDSMKYIRREFYS